MSETAAIPRIGQIGTAFTATIDEPVPNSNPVTYTIVDLTTATNVYIEFKRPDQTTFILPAVVYTAPTNGLVRLIAGDILDQVGENWECRGIADFTGGSHYPGSWRVFSVGS